MNKNNFEKLEELNLSAMADEYARQESSKQIDDFTFDERLSLMIDRECDKRHQAKIERLFKQATFSEKNASMDQIDYRKERNLNRMLLGELETNRYIDNARSLIITGACGSGKSYLANALGTNACLNEYRVKYTRLPDLLCELMISIKASRRDNFLKKYEKYDLLIIDEWLLVPLNEVEASHLLEIIERRYRDHSTIFCSQYQTEAWHKRLSGGAIGDAIMDRILSSSNEIFIKSTESMRTLAKKEE